MTGPMQQAMTDNDHHLHSLALAAFEQLHTAMLGVVDMFTHESQVTTALLGVLAQRTPITTLVGISTSPPNARASRQRSTDMKQLDVTHESRCGG